jgi:hypothetical protein
VISSTPNYSDVQQELIAEIHRTFFWPVVVNVDGNISIPDKTDFIDRDGSYIILIPDGNIESFKAEINGLSEKPNRYTRLWNFEARFLVAAANEFSILQQMEIFNNFSKLRIYNCIIVSKENDVINKEYSRPKKPKVVNAGMNLGVYTWFPYQSSDRCNEVNDITLLDSWVISAQGHFNKNTDLFPGKISKNLKGSPMKAFVRDGHWYLTTYYDQQNVYDVSAGKYIRGFEWDLLKFIFEQMNMKFVLLPTPEEFENTEESINKLIVAMFRKDADIALGGFTIHSLANSHIDTTNTYYIFRYRWYVPCSIKYPRWSSIFRILSVELWLVLIISIVIAAISTTLVGRYSCTSEWQGYKTLTSSLTNIWAVILGVSVSTMPRPPSLRSLFLAWVCFSLAFNTVFQAFLTMFLIDSGYITPIQNMDELFASGIKLAYPQEYSYVFEKCDETKQSKVKQNHVICPSKVICDNWVKYQKNVSVLLVDKTVEGYYASGVGEKSVQVRRRVFFTTGLTMIMFHGDPLMRRINEIIDRVVEAGIYNYWISMTMDTIKLKSRKIGIVRPFNGYYSLNL